MIHSHVPKEIILIHVIFVLFCCKKKAEIIHGY